MVKLEDAKSYMMIDFDEKDNDIVNFIEEAKTIIETSTGAQAEIVYNSGDEKLMHLYDIIHKIIIKNLWDEQSTSGSRLTNLYIKLRAYYRKVTNG